MNDIYTDLGILAAWCNSGSSANIHATPDRPYERQNMGAGHMGWYGRTLCGLRGLPYEGSPFMRPVNGTEGMTFADFLELDLSDDRRHPCPKCRAEFNRREKAVA